MNEITTFQSGQLPDTLEDLTQFVLVGKATLNAYMIKLRTVNKLSTAQEIRNQTLKEAQEVSTALIAAEQRIGELLLAIPKQSGNQYTSANSTQVEKAKSKSEAIKEMGYTKDEASEYQRMAQNPEIVKRVIDDALANGKVVTTSQVVKEISEEKKRSKALEEENRKLREAISSQGAENVRLKMELEKAPTREIVKEVTVEVVPDDYEESKKRLKSLESENRLLAKDREDAIEKYNKADEKLKDLERSINSPKEKALRDVEGRCIDLTTAINAFLANHGGKTIAKEEFSQLSKYERQSLERATEKLRRWLDELLDEVEVTIA